MVTPFTLTNLLKAYIKCRQNKRQTVNAIKFEINSEKNLLRLVCKLKDRTYSPGKSICFVVTYPKVREIFAADFADRIIHHLLVNEIEPIFEKHFIYDSFACRTDKGTLKGVIRLRHFINKITVNKRQPAYFAQLDIKSFFPSLDKNILYRILKTTVEKTKKSTIWKEEVLWLAKNIIFHDPTHNYHFKGNPYLKKLVPIQKSLFGQPPNVGLPIGNLTSQFFANVYLNELDQFVKRELKIRYYLRYVDDIVLLSQDPTILKEWTRKIEDFLKTTLKLTLHPDKKHFGSVDQGIDFLGYVIFPYYTLCRRRVVANCKSKIHRFNKELEDSPFVDKKFRLRMQSTLNSYYGHFRHGNCFRLRINLYNKRLQKIKEILTPVDNCQKFVLKEKFKSD